MAEPTLVTHVSLKAQESPFLATALAFFAAAGVAWGARSWNIQKICRSRYVTAVCTHTEQTRLAGAGGMGVKSLLETPQLFATMEEYAWQFFPPPCPISTLWHTALIGTHHLVYTDSESKLKRDAWFFFRILFFPEK